MADGMVPEMGMPSRRIRNPPLTMPAERVPVFGVHETRRLVPVHDPDKLRLVILRLRQAFRPVG